MEKYESDTVRHSQWASQGGADGQGQGHAGTDRVGGEEVMSWHYQVRRREDTGYVYYDIVEVYTNPTGWTKDSIAAAAESYEGVIETLEHMLADAKKYPVLIDEEHA